MTGSFQLPLNIAPGMIYIDDVTLDYFDLDMGWANPANVSARVEASRKGSFAVRVADSNGALLDASALQGVQVAMARHDFPFGTAYDPYLVRDVWVGSGFRVQGLGLGPPDPPPKKNTTQQLDMFGACGCVNAEGHGGRPAASSCTAHRAGSAGACRGQGSSHMGGWQPPLHPHHHMWAAAIGRALAGWMSPGVVSEPGLVRGCRRVALQRAGAGDALQVAGVRAVPRRVH